jgi:hypothetical protein
MLSPGEAVVPAKQSKKYAGLIQGIVADNIPGYRKSNIDKSKIPTGGRQSTTDITLGGTTVSVPALQAPRIIETLQNAIDSVATEFGRDITPELERNLAGLEKVTVKSVDDIVKNFSGNLIKLATRVTEKTALEMAHADEGRVLSREETRSVGSGLQEQYPNRIHETMMKAEKPTRFLSQGVFGVPRASNQQDLLYTGKENADWVRQYPEIFMDGIAKFGKLDANDPRLKEFAMAVGDEFEKAGSKSITESDFAEIITKTLSKELDETINGVIRNAQKTFQVVQQTNIGSNTKRRSDPGAGDSFVMLPDGAQVGRKPGGVPAYTRSRDSEGFGATAYAFHQQVAIQRAMEAGIPQLVNGIVPIVSGAVSTAVAEGTKEGAKRSGSQTASAVEQGLNESTERKSPPKAAIKIGRDYGFALNGALRDLIPRVRVSGEAFGLTATTAMTTISPAMMQHLNQTAGRIFKPYLDAQGNLITVSQQRIKVINDETTATKRATDADRMRLIAMQAQFVASMGGSLIPGFGSQDQNTQQDDEDGKPDSKPKSKFERYSSGFRTATFALTSLAGAATMSGGAVGEAAGSIMAFSGVAYALITVMDLLSMAATNNKNAMLAQIGSFLMFSKGGALKKAGGPGFLATIKNAFLPVTAAFTKAGGGAKGFFGGLKALGPALLGVTRGAVSFIPVIGQIALAITALVVITNLVRDAKERERLATEGVADALKNTKEEMDGLADLLGKEKQNALTDRLSQKAASTDSQQKVSLVAQLTTGDLSEKFAEIYKKDIDAMRTMSQNELKTYQNSLAMNLQSTGQYSQEEIEAIIKALQTEAERTDVSFEFKSIDITSKNIDNFRVAVKSMTTEMENSLKYNADAETKTEALNTATAAYATTLQSLANALFNGAISGKQYTERIQILKEEILKLPNAQAFATDMLNDFADTALAGNPAMAGMVRSVQGIGNQMLVMSGIATGVIPTIAELSEVMAAFNTIAAYEAGDKTISEAFYQTQVALVKKYTAQVDAAAVAIAKLNGVTNETGGTKEKTPWESATEQLRNQTKEMSNASTAYNKLLKAGVGAGDAFAAAKDPALATAIATTKVGTEKWRELVKLIKEFNANAKLMKVGDTLKEIANENALLTKFDKLSRYLQQMGLSGEDIQSVIGDPELAKGLIYATGEGSKGLEDINRYISQIKDNKELKISILPLADQFKERMQKVSDWFSNERNALEIKLKIDTKADTDIARKAQQQIDTINFQVDDFEAGLTRLEDGEEAINEKYDNRIEALDKVIAANDRIAEQNKEELNIFQMVARGDIAGAAAGIAQLQQQKAKNALEAKKESLEAQRKNELESMTAEVMVNGQKVMLTRNEIEANLKNLKQQIFEIEEKTLEPAQRRIDILTATKDNLDASLTALGLTEDEWVNIEKNIDLAKTRTTEYLGELQKALDVARQIPGALDGTSKSGQEIVGKPDIVPETDFGANAKIPKPKPAPVPGGQPPAPVVIPNPGDPGFIGPVAPPGTTTMPPATESIAINTQKYLDEIKKQKDRSWIDQAIHANAHYDAMAQIEIDISKGITKNEQWLDSYYGNRAKANKNISKHPGVLASDVFWSVYKNNIRQSAFVEHADVLNNAKKRYMQFKMDGGYISGPGTGTSDSIPAMLSNGEYVIRANAVKSIGTDTLDRMNYADKNRFADGGQVGRAGGWSTSYKTTATEEAKAKAAREKLFKKGGAQGFEAGFQGMMSDLGKNDIVKGFGSFLGDKTNVASGITRGLLSALSLPVELMGSVAKTVVTGVGQASKGDILGLAKTAFHVVTGGVIRDAGLNAISGVVNPEEQKASMFEQAAEQVIKDKTFGAGNAESDALARIIGGSLNLFGDPLSYLGVGVAAKGVKTAASAAMTSAKLGDLGGAIRNTGRAAGYAPGVLGLPNLSDASTIGSLVSKNSKLGSLITDAKDSLAYAKRIRQDSVEQKRIADETKAAMVEKIKEYRLNFGEDQALAYANEVAKTIELSVGPKIENSNSSLLPNIKDMSSNQLLGFISSGIYESRNRALPKAREEGLDDRLSPSLLARTDNKRTRIQSSFYPAIDTLRSKGLLPTPKAMRTIIDQLTLGTQRDAVLRKGPGQNSVFAANGQLTTQPNDFNIGLMEQIGTFPKFVLSGDNRSYVTRSVNKRPLGQGLLRNLLPAIFGRNDLRTDMLGPLSAVLSKKAILKGLEPNEKDYYGLIGIHEGKHIYDKFAAHELGMQAQHKMQENAVMEANARAAEAAVTQKRIKPYNGMTGPKDLASKFVGEDEKSVKRSIDAYVFGSRSHQVHSEWYKAYADEIEKITNKTGINIHKPEQISSMKNFAELLLRHGLTKNAGSGDRQKGIVDLLIENFATSRTGSVERDLSQEAAGNVLERISERQQPKFKDYGDMFGSDEYSSARKIDSIKSFLATKKNNFMDSARFAKEWMLGPSSKVSSGVPKSVVKETGKLSRLDPKSGESFREVFRNIHLTDYDSIRDASGERVSKYDIPQFRESFNRYPSFPTGSLHPTENMSSVARGVVERSGRWADVNALMLHAKKYFDRHTAENPWYLEFEQGIIGTPYEDILSRNKESYNNMYHNLSTNTYDELLAQVRREEELAMAANDYLTSPKFIYNRLQDKVESAAKERISGFGSRSSLLMSRHLSKYSDKLPGGIQGALYTELGRHRSKYETLNMMHPKDVPVETGRAYGPGTYMAQTREVSDAIFSGFGANVYKQDTSILGWMKILLSKGYISENLMKQKMADFQLHFDEQKNFATGNSAFNFRRDDSLTNMSYEHPFIQGLLKEGYIGYKHGDALANWIIGTSKSFGLKPVADQVTKENLISKILGGGIEGIIPAQQIKPANPLPKPKPKLPQPKPNRTVTELLERMGREQPEFAKGGLVAPKYFANGGMVMPKYFAKGGDVVPAMLTPGEFVMTKHAVDNYGVDNLKAINSGAAPGNSVYNGYNINVNVRSNSNPDQIANAVMTQIRQVNAQQVRGSKF